MSILDFQPLTLEDIVKLRPYFEQNLCRICDCTIGGTFLWRDFFDTQYAICDGLVYFKVRYFTGEVAFPPPHGEGEMEKPAIDRIIAYSEEKGIKPQLCAVSRSRLSVIRGYYPNSIARTCRDWSDYLYEAEDLRSLAGRRFSGQRNHINRFLRTYSDHGFAPISEDNTDAVRRFFEEYTRPGVEDTAAYQEGNVKALEVLERFDIYGQIGGVLCAGGEIVGAAMGEVVGDTLFVHIEKAKTEVPGSYQMLVNSFAKMYATEGVQYINREEDDGVPGLRRSKESYHPIALLDKYIVELRE